MVSQGPRPGAGRACPRRSPGSLPRARWWSPQRNGTQAHELLARPGQDLDVAREQAPMDDIAPVLVDGLMARQE